MDSDLAGISSPPLRPAASGCGGKNRENAGGDDEADEREELSGEEEDNEEEGCKGEASDEDNRIWSNKFMGCLGKYSEVPEPIRA